MRASSLATIIALLLVGHTCASAQTGAVKVSWSSYTAAPAGTVVTFTLKRGPKGGPYTTVATAINALSYSDSGLPNGQQVCYVLVADAVGFKSSPPSLEACGTTKAAELPSLDVAPSGLAVTIP